MPAPTDLTTLAQDVAALRGDLAETRRVVTQLVAGMAQQDNMIVDTRNSQDRILKSLEATQGWLSRVADTSEEMLKKIFRTLSEFETTMEARNHTLQATATRVDHAENALRLLHEDSTQLREAATQCIAKLEEHQSTLSMWIGQLANRVWPNAQAFHEEIQRVFPQGFSAIPYDRLAPRKSKS